MVDGLEGSRQVSNNGHEQKLNVFKFAMNVSIEIKKFRFLSKRSMFEKTTKILKKDIAFKIENFIFS